MTFRLKMLSSYAYIKDQRGVDHIRRMCGYADVLIDSGAFTDYWSGIREAAGKKRSFPKIDVGAYIEFCRELGPSRGTRSTASPISSPSTRASAWRAASTVPCPLPKSVTRASGNAATARPRSTHSASATGPRS